MFITKVDAGICGFQSIIKIKSSGSSDVEIFMETECPALKPLANELKEVDAYQECFAKVGESPVFLLARKYCRHAACPVPTAILKGIEVAAALALPKNVGIEITKVEEK